MDSPFNRQTTRLIIENLYFKIFYGLSYRFLVTNPIEEERYKHKLLNK